MPIGRKAPRAITDFKKDVLCAFLQSGLCKKAFNWTEKYCESDKSRPFIRESCRLNVLPQPTQRSRKHIIKTSWF